MRPPTDEPTTGQPTDHRVTVQEAAALLGISEDAVRSRLKRGTLRKEKNQDGTVFVVLGEDGAHDQPKTGQPTDQQSSLIEVLHDQVAYLREQLDQEREANRENRRIIAALTQRIPELEAPSAPREASVNAMERAGGDVPSESREPSERRSWLRRFFFGGGRGI